MSTSTRNRFVAQVMWPCFKISRAYVPHCCNGGQRVAGRQMPLAELPKGQGWSLLVSSFCSSILCSIDAGVRQKCDTSSAVNYDGQSDVDGRFHQSLISDAKARRIPPQGKR